MNCKNCGYENFKERFDGKSYGFCGNRKCTLARSEWMKRNWDQLPAGKFKNKYEEDFYRVTPEQREQFATFFSLIRPKRKSVKRVCFQCKSKLGQVERLSPFDFDNRMCTLCEAKVSRMGALAHS